MQQPLQLRDIRDFIKWAWLPVLASLKMAKLRKPAVESAIEQIVGILDRHHPGKPPGFGQLETFHGSPRCFVGDTDMAYLTVFYQVSQYLKCLFDGYGLFIDVVLITELAKKVGASVGPVELVEVDIVGLEALQTTIDGGLNIGAVETHFTATDMG